jgi:uncharacterized protein involved in outer membrane biogenesis
MTTDTRPQFFESARHGYQAMRAEFARAPWSWPGALRWTGIIVAAFIIAILVTLYYMDWNTMRGPVARYASARLGRTVGIGHLSVHLFTRQPRIAIDGLTVANPSWLQAPYAASIPHLRIEIRLFPLLRGALVVPLVQLTQPDILFVRDGQGRTNWKISGAASNWTMPDIHNFLIDQGHFHIVDRIRKMDFAGNISSQEHSDRARPSAFVATGSGTLNGSKVLAEIHGGPLINVDETKPYAFSVDLRAGTSHALMVGSLLHPFHLGQYAGHANFTGADLSDLYYLTGLPMPGTPPYRLSGDLSRDGKQLYLKNLSGIIGWSDLHGNLALDTSRERPFLSGALSSHNLRFEDLGVLFGRPAKPGKPDAALPAPKPGAPMADALVLPDVPLHTEHMRHMDVSLDYKADQVNSVDFPMRAVTLHVSLVKGVLTIKPMTLDFIQGKMSGSLIIDGSRDVPVTSTDMRVTGIHLENFIAKADKPITGLLEARAVLKGHGHSVHDAAATAKGTFTVVVPGGTVRRSLAEWLGVNVLSGLGLTLAGDKSSTSLRCAVGHFDVQDGVMTAQQFVLDTGPVLVKGQGSVDLGKETVNLRFAGQPKSFQLVRLRAPITVSGPLDHPAIGLMTDTALAQGGIGLVLGILAPPAALLAFVDPAVADNADCAALLAGAEKKGALPRKKPLAAPPKPQK